MADVVDCSACHRPHPQPGYGANAAEAIPGAVTPVSAMRENLASIGKGHSVARKGTWYNTIDIIRVSGQDHCDALQTTRLCLPPPGTPHFYTFRKIIMFFVVNIIEETHATIEVALFV